MEGDYSTAQGLKNDDWLAFWGSYLGGLLGSVAALIALYINIRQQEKFHETTKELNRLEILPSMICHFAPEDSYAEDAFCFLHVLADQSIKMHTVIKRESIDKELKGYPGHSRFYFFVKNIGLGPAFDVTISFKSEQDDSPTRLGGFAPSERKSYILTLENRQAYDIFLNYTDSFNLPYTSKSAITYEQETNSIGFTATASPKLNEKK